MTTKTKGLSEGPWAALMIVGIYFVCQWFYCWGWSAHSETLLAQVFTLLLSLFPETYWFFNDVKRRVKCKLLLRLQQLINLTCNFSLIRLHLFALGFKFCNKCGSCKRKHKTQPRWREWSHGERCVHSPPTFTRRVWSATYTFEVWMPLCKAK